MDEDAPDDLRDGGGDRLPRGVVDLQVADDPGELPEDSFKVAVRGGMVGKRENASHTAALPLEDAFSIGCPIGGAVVRKEREDAPVLLAHLDEDALDAVGVLGLLQGIAQDRAGGDVDPHFFCQGDDLPPLADEDDARPFGVDGDLGPRIVDTESRMIGGRISALLGCPKPVRLEDPGDGPPIEAVLRVLFIEGDGEFFQGHVARERLVLLDHPLDVLGARAAVRAPALGLGREVGVGIGFSAPAEEAREGNSHCLCDLRVGQLALEVAQESHAERPRLRREVGVSLVEADAGMISLIGEDLISDPKAEDLPAEFFVRAFDGTALEDLPDAPGGLIAGLPGDAQRPRRPKNDPRPTGEFQSPEDLKGQYDDPQADCFGERLQDASKKIGGEEV